jgi:hypothetical protein
MIMGENRVPEDASVPCIDVPWSQSLSGVDDLDPTAELRLGEAAVSLSQEAVKQREDDWLNAIADQLNRLGAVAYEWSPEKIDGNPAFVSAFAAATETARQTNSPVKLLALRNAVLNSVSPDAPEEDEQAVLLGWLRELTPWHLQILVVAADPMGWFARSGDLDHPAFERWCTRGELLEAALPLLRGHRDLYEAVGRDLDTRGLTSGSLQETRTAATVWTPWATSLGQRLIAFSRVPRP